MTTAGVGVDVGGWRRRRSVGSFIHSLCNGDMTDPARLDHQSAFMFQVIIPGGRAGESKADIIILWLL